MILSLDKFLVIIFDKYKRNHVYQIINIDEKEVKVVSKVKRLQIEIDDKLDLKHHINKICKSASNQLNASIRLKDLMIRRKKGASNTFVMSNFNYRSLVWKLSSSQLLSEMESLQKRALRFLLDGHDSTYEDLLEKSGRPNMNLKRQITRCIEIYQTLIELNPRCMNGIFKLRNTGRQKEWKKIS